MPTARRPCGVRRRRAAASGRASSFCADDRVGPVDRFVEQPVQADGVAAAGLERPAVVAQHGAEADVLQLDVVVAPQPGGGEELLEVQRLAMIDDVQDRVGPPLVHAVLDRGQVGRGVEERAVLLLHDHRRVVALEKDAHGARRSRGRGPCACRSVDDAGAAGRDRNSRRACGRTSRRAAGRCVRSRPGRAAGTRRHSAQVLGIAGVQLGGLGQHGAADVGVRREQRRRAADRLRPRRSCFAARPARSQLGQLLLRPVAAAWRAFLAPSGRLGAALARARRLRLRLADLALAARDRLVLRLVVVDQRVDQPVQPAQLVDRRLRERRLVDEVLVAVDDHPELRAPVADVVVADHAVAEELQHAVEGVADHGRADVADVHRLGDVGRRSSRPRYVRGVAAVAARRAARRRATPRRVARRASRL